MNTTAHETSFDYFCSVCNPELRALATTNAIDMRQLGYRESYTIGKA